MALNKVKSRQNLLLGFSVFIFLAMAIIFEIDSNKAQDLPEKTIECSIKNLDGEIKIDWKILIDKKKFDSVEVTLKGEDVSEVKNFPADDGSYSFLGGKHGKGYDIKVVLKNDNEIIGKAETRAVFLDYAKLPTLPIISINTRNGKFPTFKMANKPPEVLGETSVENELLDCEMMMFKNGVRIAESRAKIRVRGNSSAKDENSPYKLKLNSPLDLLEMGNAYADKEWTLLNTGYTLKTYFVTVLANIFQVEWQPKIRYVNLVFNGEWRGCYILSESVKRGRNRVNISKSGYLFEYDPYFWRPDTKFFKTNLTDKKYGFTFKYPKQKNLTPTDMQNLKNYLQDLEPHLKSKDERYADYIDVESFVKWVLVHDLVGTVDGAGSNKYFYKYDFDLENPTSTKIKMGPLWDFDSSFRVLESWSFPHYWCIYMDLLFRIESFKQAYKDEFYSNKDKILPALREDLDELQKTQLAAYQESWDLNYSRWKIKNSGVEEEINFNLKLLEDRINLIDKKLKNDDWK